MFSCFLSCALVTPSPATDRRRRRIPELGGRPPFEGSDADGPERRAGKPEPAARGVIDRHSADLQARRPPREEAGAVDPGGHEASIGGVACEVFEVDAGGGGETTPGEPRHELQDVSPV